MTKRQLIEALEKCGMPDDTEVLKSWYVATEDYDCEKTGSIYDIEITSEREYGTGRTVKVIVL